MTDQHPTPTGPGAAEVAAARSDAGAVEPGSAGTGTAQSASAQFASGTSGSGTSGSATSGSGTSGSGTSGSATSGSATSGAATSGTATSGAAQSAVPPIVELGPGWPGWVLRLLLLTAGFGAVGTLLSDGLSILVLVVLLGLALLTAALPASPAPALLIAAVVITVTVVGGDPLRPEVLVEIPLLHLVHLTAAITALLPVRSVIRPAALVAPARRFVLVQVAVFAVVAMAEMLPTGRNTTVVELAGLIAASGLVLLAIRLLTRGR
jgi:hypothetical protein